MTSRRLEPFRIVLVPIDFTQGSVAALDRALVLPLAPDARIELLHVLPDQITAKVRAKVEACAKEALARAVAHARSVAADRRRDHLADRTR